MSPGHNGFLNYVSITFINKTDPSDPFKWEDWWRRTLKTMLPFGLNIEGSVSSIIMVINDPLRINNYLALISCYCFGLFQVLLFVDNGYVFDYFYWYYTAWNKGFSD